MARRPFRTRQARFETLEDRSLMTVNFVFDYSLDSKGFFNDPSRRALLDFAGHMVADRLDDRLSAISPSGSNKWSASFPNPGSGQPKTINNKSIAADTILIYAGGRDLASPKLAVGTRGAFASHGSSAWNQTVRARGQSGALGPSPTDVGPWGGAITFDTAGVDWHFGKTTTGLSSVKNDFLSVAMHELGHILGINSSSKPWLGQISNGIFHGPKSVAANSGRGVPVDPDSGHFQKGVTSDGLEAAMAPSLLRGTRKLFTTLDFAALDDVGWDVGAVQQNLNQTITRAPHRLTHLDGKRATSESIQISDSIPTAKDVDIFRIYADEGTSIRVDVGPRSGGTPLDTYVRLFTGSGTELTNANQSATGSTDTLQYTTTRSDYYYVGISSVGDRTYKPNFLFSGPGGATGDYEATISMADNSSLHSANIAAPAPASPAAIDAALLTMFSDQAELQDAGKRRR